MPFIEQRRPLSMPSGGQSVNIKKRNFPRSARESDFASVPLESHRVSEEGEEGDCR